MIPKATDYIDHLVPSYAIFKIQGYSIVVSLLPDFIPTLVRFRVVPINGLVEVSLTTDACHGSIRHLEHVETVVTLSASVRGQVALYLTSPAGTRSTMLSQRDSDRTGDGFNGWPFMTTHNWGESPTGVWRLEVRNGASVGGSPSIP